MAKIGRVDVEIIRLTEIVKINKYETKADHKPGLIKYNPTVYSQQRRHAATAGDTDQQEANFYVLPTAYRTLNNGMIISILY